ncbi:MAG: hypothetical protein E6J90_12485 [Deltaproteobacteria bacterium]|nr:MAG: hypothetical protein E6J91_44970 [Deltaproteobacteria bacterium]TMQ22443.1 MAG: hypothetical protein E6J90_12485 [Deltaproteobacteria bacterium]
MARPQYLLSLAVLAALAVPALARPTKVALTGIDGDTGGLGNAVAAALDDTDLEVVAGKPVVRAIQRLGLGKALGERDLVRLADELDVDAVVKGVFDRRGRKLRFTIFASGKSGKPFSLQVGNAGSDRFRSLVRTTLVARLAKAVSSEDASAKGKTAKPKVQQATDDEDPLGGKKATPKSNQVAGDEPVRSKKTTAKSAEVAEDEPAKGKKAKAKSDEVAEDDKPARGKKATSKSDEVAGDEAPARGKKAKSKSDEAVENDSSARRKKAKAKSDDVADDEPARGKKAKTKSDEVADDEPAKGKKAKAKSGEVADDEPARTGAAGAGGADAAAMPATGDAVAASEDDAPHTTRRRVATRDDDDPAASLRAEREPSSRVSHRANLAALRVDLGASMAGRRLQFTSRAFADAPRPYQNAPVLGARAEAELYPLALIAPGSLLAGLGVAADYDRTVSLTLRATQEMTVPLKITERHYSFGARYRLAFGHRPTSPTLTLGAGYAVRTFVVDRRGLMTPTSIDLPDVDYRMLTPGLAFRLPIGGALAITLDGRGLYVTSAGAIQRTDQYGKVSALGGTASAGVEVLIGQRIAVRAAAEATQLNLKFAGTGALATSRDGDSSTVDVRGATDRYYGGTATLAVMY